MEVWEAIRAAEILGSDDVIITIKQAKLLLECARLINEGAVVEVFDKKKGMVVVRSLMPTAEPIRSDTVFAMTNHDLRSAVIELSMRL